MATYTARTAKSATLSTTVVDQVTLTGPGELITVINRSASGGPAIWFTYGEGSGTAPADPTTAGDDCYVVPADYGAFSIRAPETTNGHVVKILGSANPYTVSLVWTPGT